MGKKVLIVTGDSGEGYEAWYAVHRLREGGHEPVVAAPSKRRLHLVMHDFELGWDTYVERPGYGMEADVAITEVDAAEYDAVLVLGGRAPEFLRHNQTLLDIIRRMDSDGKWILSICHGIQVLVAAGLVKDRCVTCYEHVRLEAESAGATFVEEEAVRDGRLVTAQTWESHPEFYREVMRCLDAESA